MNKNLIIGGAILVAITGGYLLTNVNKTPATMTVIGEGKVSVKPEEFYLIVTSVNTGTNIGQVLDEGEATISKLITLSRKAGGDDSDVKKSFYQITPQGDGSFIVANAFSITSKKVEAVNALIKDLYANGATTVSNATFNTSNQEETDQKARIEAIKNAKTQAEKIAEAAGKRVGKIMSIADDNTKGTSSVGDAGINGLSSVTFTKNVSVVYEIK